MRQGQILEMLPENQDEGLFIEDIAEQPSVAPGTVRNELYRLRRQGLVVTTRCTIKGKAGYPSGERYDHENDRFEFDASGKRNKAKILEFNSSDIKESSIL